MNGGRAMAPVLAAIGLVALAAPAHAHRLDEYLQATVIDVTRQHITLAVRLTPGIEVAPNVIHQIDTNGDGVLSPREQQDYAGQVARELSFSLNGHQVALKVGEAAFPSVAAMRAGDGVITLRFDIGVALGPGPYRLACTSHAMGHDRVYLVNTLLPHDPDIHAGRQWRSADQSSYRLDFTVDRHASGPVP
ncbi:hypothetical protein [Komagataeibacter sp. FNDCF1]|uniref:hypothetical protein n=1 Tax=Komagataeibacter sp. FNDCF1 TaxID=2878681 RepID=UPI001E3168ED|nr:hypothetical protein [Komagataeibacter sp. FNDCF1]MCE2563579.1 hypothetical protein [Komagataeibacter sp. FNDCF1]